MGVEKASLVSLGVRRKRLILYSNQRILTGPLHLLIPKDGPLPQYLQKMGEIIIREELAKGPISPIENRCQDKMSSFRSRSNHSFISKKTLIEND